MDLRSRHADPGQVGFDGGQSLGDPAVAADLRGRGRSQVLEPARNGADLVLDGPHHVADAVHVVAGITGQGADIGRYDGEPTAPLTCPRRLHRAADGKHVGLHRDQRDAVDDLLDSPAGDVETADQLDHRARIVLRLADALGQGVDGRVVGRQPRRQQIRPGHRVGRGGTRNVGGLPDLHHGGGGLMRRRGLGLRAAADLVDRGEDLPGGPGQLLHRGGKLLGGGPDLFGARRQGRPRHRRFCHLRQRMGGLLALLERGRLLLHGALRLGRGGGLLLGGASHLLGAALGLAHPRLRLDRRRQDSLRAAREAAHVLTDGNQAADHGLPAFGLVARLLGRCLDTGGDGTHVGGDRIGQRLHFAGPLLRHFGEGADLVGDDGEAAPVIPGPRGLDRRIQRQQVRLVGDIAHDGGDLGDVAGLGVQRAHDVHQTELAGRVVLHGGDQRLDLPRHRHQQCLQPLGPVARVFGALAGLGEYAAKVGDGGLRLLGGPGRFLRGGGDLHQSAAQLFGGGRCLGDAAGEFLGCGADPFGRLLPPGPLPLARAALGRGWNGHGLVRLERGWGFSGKVRRLHQGHDFPRTF